MFREPTNDPKWFLRKVEIRKSLIHGLGVFATEQINKHEIFESSPVIIFHRVILEDFYQYNNRDRHILDDYVFRWEKGHVAITMGYGSIYNHSNNHSNASYGCLTPEDIYGNEVVEDDSRIQFFAKRDIEPGEEILIHYNLGRGELDFDEAGSTFIINE